MFIQLEWIGMHVREFLRDPPPPGELEYVTKMPIPLVKQHHEYEIGIHNVTGELIVRSWYDIKGTGRIINKIMSKVVFESREIREMTEHILNEAISKNKNVDIIVPAEHVEFTLSISFHRFNP